MKSKTSLMIAFLLSISVNCYAESKIIGDWVVFINDDRSGVFAYTTSESGQLFGLMCRASNEGCLWTLKTDNKCEEESESIALLNSDLGAFSAKTLCQSTDDGSNYVHLGSVDDLEEIVRGGKYLGIAMPLASGKFRAIRFSLSGSGKAVDAAYAIHEHLRKSIDDEIL